MNAEQVVGGSQFVGIDLFGCRRTLSQGFLRPLEDKDIYISIITPAKLQF